MAANLEAVDLYLRKSTKDEGRSVERQLSELTDAAEREDLTIGRVFVDPDFSASRHRRRERPDFEVSRGSRDAAEWFAFLDLCRARGVRIWVSTHERVYDLSRRRDWRALADEGVDAADESEKIRERVLSGKRKAAREGRPPGRLPFGFRRIYDERGRFVRQEAHPERAPIVREMITRVADGEALHAIARDLTARGVVTPSGAPWHGRYIRQTVLRPAYAGRLVHQGRDIGEAGWEPIVDPGVWRKAVARLSDPARRSTTRGTALAHWLSNATRCGRCRTVKLQHRTGGTKRPRRTYFCPGCGQVIGAEPLEDFVGRVLLARLERPDAASVFLTRADDAAVLAAQREVDELEAERAEWVALAKARKITPASFAEIESELVLRIERAQEKLQRLSVPPQYADLSLNDVPARWPAFGPDLKRRYVRALVDLVVHPAARRGPVFDPRRLGESRWTGDELTWAGHWAADETLTP
jgi:site-specific DNA recombinase